MFVLFSRGGCSTSRSGRRRRRTTDEICMDDVISRLQVLEKHSDVQFNSLFCEMEVLDIAKKVGADEQATIKAGELFEKQPSLLEVDAPIKVVGCVHGKFKELIRLFDLIGRVPQQKLLFLGDYVDRGRQSIEVMVLLFALLIRHPNRIFLLRGNHETKPINQIYGFKEECRAKYSTRVWYEFNATFDWMPLAAIINSKVLCVHGGLSPEIVNLDTIREIVRPCEPQDIGLVTDLLWSDPTNKGDGLFHSLRGISYMFGTGVVEKACTNLGIDLIIRSRQVVHDGYEVMAGRKLITVFSSPNYGGFSNTAAVLCLDDNLQISFQQLSMASTRGRKAPGIACSPEPNIANLDREWIKEFACHVPKTLSDMIKDNSRIVWRNTIVDKIGRNYTCTLPNCSYQASGLSHSKVLQHLKKEHRLSEEDSNLFLGSNFTGSPATKTVSVREMRACETKEELLDMLLGGRPNAGNIQVMHHVPAESDTKGSSCSVM